MSLKRTTAFARCCTAYVVRCAVLPKRRRSIRQRTRPTSQWLPLVHRRARRHSRERPRPSRCLTIHWARMVHRRTGHIRIRAFLTCPRRPRPRLERSPRSTTPRSPRRRIARISHRSPSRCEAPMPRAPAPMRFPVRAEAADLRARARRHRPRRYGQAIR